MDTLSTFFTPIVGFFITVAFGLWLGRVGKPYNGILFNIHKLIALGAVILTAVQIYNLLKDSQAQALLFISIIVAAIIVIVLFASGAFLSIGKLKYETMKTIHNIAPVLAVIAMALAIYLFGSNP